MNAAAALTVEGRAADITDGYERARAAIDSGAARRVFDRLRQATDAVKESAQTQQAALSTLLPNNGKSNGQPGTASLSSRQDSLAAQVNELLSIVERLSKRLEDVELSPSGNYNFLTTARLKH